MTDTENLDNAADGGLRTTDLFGIGAVVHFHWDDSGARGGPNPPDVVKILGAADPSKRGKDGLLVLNIEEDTKYVALPHELKSLPNSQLNQPELA